MRSYSMRRLRQHLYQVLRNIVLGVGSRKAFWRKWPILSPEARKETCPGNKENNVPEREDPELMHGAIKHM